MTYDDAIDAECLNDYGIVFEAIQKAGRALSRGAVRKYTGLSDGRARAALNGLVRTKRIFVGGGSRGAPKVYGMSQASCDAAVVEPEATLVNRRAPSTNVCTARPDATSSSNEALITLCRIVDRDGAVVRVGIDFFDALALIRDMDAGSQIIRESDGMLLSSARKRSAWVSA